MIDAGLLDGDIVVVERLATAKAGGIVVDWSTARSPIKRLRNAGAWAKNAVATWLLDPANAAYEMISPQRPLEILGVVTGLFRRFRR